MQDIYNPLMRLYNTDGKYDISLTYPLRYEFCEIALKDTHADIITNDDICYTRS